MTSEPNDADVQAEIVALVTGLRQVCHDKDTCAVLASLAEMYARVAAECLTEEADLDAALAFFARSVKGWWLADRLIAATEPSALKARQN